ncbi:regulator of G-protein signaling 17 isoform X2 [Anthonomus grandis grandis]|uniref:regulator of G-protein signaling 17 isoform X2 n=1 Tax=Anthonomus grandis grandis TaxID=2921223 RepID=UPI002166BF13|nr:regulator of G-protein signaling 17 isoform X2 [Anthonomus grandis grandis]
MSYSVPERGNVHSPPTSLHLAECGPTAGPSSSKISGTTRVQLHTISRGCKGRKDEKLVSALATSLSSRTPAPGAGTPPGATGPPQNGPQSGSPQGSQTRSKHCSSMLFCCCCKCPWTTSTTENRNDENGTAKNSTSDLDTCVSPRKKISRGAMEEIRVTMDDLRCWSKSFDKLMNSNAGRKVFRNFLKGEYSEENILFWLACEDFKKHNDRSYIERWSRLIYMHYIHPDSSTEVSLDSRVREIVKKQLQNPHAEMYDEAQLQIYTLMQRDSYPRFINSQMFKNLVQQTEKKGKDKFWIQPQKTPSLHTIDLHSVDTLMGGEPGQANQSTPLLTAVLPSVTTPVSDYSERDQDTN